MNGDMLSRRLRRRGFEVELATDGARGFQSARENRPDLILMDLGLPEVDGWESTRMIRDNAGTHDIPIVALTAHAMVSDRERALASGFDEFATKPVDFDRVIEIINRLLGLSGEVFSRIASTAVSSPSTTQS